MPSSSPSQCFVYITLPGAVSAVTAGRFVLEETPKGDPLGRFVYGRSYLQNSKAVDIDPIELKLSEATYETIQLNGVFGALRDAGPDFWGRRIIERQVRENQVQTNKREGACPNANPLSSRCISTVACEAQPRTR